MSYYGPLTSTLRWGTRVQRSGSMGANCASIPISTLLTALPCRSVVWKLYMRQLYICERVWYKNNINTTYIGTLSGGGTNRFLQAITASSFLVGKLWSLTELFRRWSVVVHNIKCIKCRDAVDRDFAVGDGSRPLSTATPAYGATVCALHPDADEAPLWSV